VWHVDNDSNLSFFVGADLAATAMPGGPWHTLGSDNAEE
jgi:hypothetical protein